MNNNTNLKAERSYHDSLAQAVEKATFDSVSETEMEIAAKIKNGWSRRDAENLSMKDFGWKHQMVATRNVIDNEWQQRRINYNYQRNEYTYLVKLESDGSAKIYRFFGYCDKIDCWSFSASSVSLSRELNMHG